jgi:hypothetical protein
MCPIWPYSSSRPLIREILDVCHHTQRFGQPRVAQKLLSEMLRTHASIYTARMHRFPSSAHRALSISVLEMRSSMSSCRPTRSCSHSRALRPASVTTMMRAAIRRHFIVSGKVVWTTSLPQAAGRYWWRTSDRFDDPVYWDLYEIDTAGYIAELQCTAFDIKGLHPDCEWAGPIDSSATL